MGFWNRSSKANQQPSDTENANQEPFDIEKMMQEIAEKNRRAKENWENQDHSDLWKIVGIQEKLLEGERELFLASAVRYIRATKEVKQIDSLNEMLRLHMHLMLGRLSGVAAQSVFCWYAAGISDIARLLVEAKDMDEKELKDLCMNPPPDNDE